MRECSINIIDGDSDRGAEATQAPRMSSNSELLGLLAQLARFYGVNETRISSDQALRCLELLPVWESSALDRLFGLFLYHRKVGASSFPSTISAISTLILAPTDRIGPSPAILHLQGETMRRRWRRRRRGRRV